MNCAILWPECPLGLGATHPGSISKPTPPPSEVAGDAEGVSAPASPAPQPPLHPSLSCSLGPKKQSYLSDRRFSPPFCCLCLPPPPPPVALSSLKRGFFSRCQHTDCREVQPAEMSVSVALKKSFLLARAVRGCLLGLQSLTVGCSWGVDLGPKSAPTTLNLWILCKGKVCGINTCCAPSWTLQHLLCIHTPAGTRECGVLLSFSHRRRLSLSRGGWAPGLWSGLCPQHHAAFRAQRLTSSFLTCLPPPPPPPPRA